MCVSSHGNNYDRLTRLNVNISFTDKVWKIDRRISSTKLSKLDVQCITGSKRASCAMADPRPGAVQHAR